MASFMNGTLVVADRCLRVNSTTGNSYLLIWPPDFAVDTSSEPIQILDGKGTVVARVGDEVFVDGGAVPGLLLVDVAEQGNVQEHCPGPYWLVGVGISIQESQE